MRVISEQGDTVDAICYRYLGATSGLVERVIDLNPGLAARGPVLPAGIAIELPRSTSTAGTPMQALVQLWD